MILTKKFKFCAAHRLKWHKGKCRRLHGHTYKLEIGIYGQPDENGIIIDFSDFKTDINKKIINKLDHRDLNDIIPNPTAENILLWIKKQLDGYQIAEIKLWEGENNAVKICNLDEWRD